MADTRRANYALVTVQEHLGPNDEYLDLPWAEYVGNKTSRFEFTVPTADASDAYVELQAYDVGEYGHELLVNDTELTGFDLPPANGWQYWMDPVTGVELREGTNTVQIRRDQSTTDSLAIGTLTVHWREPVE
ncbi:hypothetical protein VB773_04555 [Haloarculaceae archaeon H-GB2-1]|nr:hypothetical protein [Haloarculaceae archaeon H-GB1-1]MEA5388869.1 hypothetical protein [Haloarculaceae archaeon H-GB11]MEA5406923.1 hypothetical protein [Haloarculaceae archaeon H-GB2-1]